MPELQHAVAQIAPGSYAVGVSGGADSVALLHLLHHCRPDLALYVVHLDHQTRGEASTADAQFVRALAERWDIPCTLATRAEVEPWLTIKPSNPSALYRALRYELFRRVVAEHKLAGLLLAHHADDQAETVLQRLLRGSGPAGLVGMRQRSTQRGLLVLRPLLEVRAEALRQYLHQNGQTWREDASNLSGKYARNRLRAVLREFPEMGHSLRQLSTSCAALQEWLTGAAPALSREFATAELVRLPRTVAAESAGRWLAAHRVPSSEITSAVIGRLIEMAVDAATAPRQCFPGKVMIHRHRGRISAEAP